MENPPQNLQEQIIKGLTQAQPVLRRYILAAVLNHGAMEEILQETNIALWRKADEFDGDQPFLPWALHFAKLQILAYRKRAAGGRFVPLEDDVLDALATDGASHLLAEDARLTHIGACLDKLPKRDIALLAQRYTDGLSLKAIAERENRSEGSLQQLFFRIRRRLRHCIEARIAKEGLA